MRTPSVAVVMIGFAAYAYGATVLSVAWYLRRDRPELDLTGSLLWAGLTYAPWLAVGVLVWAVMRRWGAGWKATAALAWAMTVVVPLIAAFGTRLDMDFLGRAAASSDWIERIIDRLPVALLLYTATVAVGLAATQWRMAREARRLVERLREALTIAKGVRNDDARLLVSTGRSRASIDVQAVEWFASAGNYVVVNWNGREGLVRNTLQALEARLDARLFARIHRSSMVNLARVAQVQPLSDGSWRLTMESGAELVVSRTYRDVVLERLGGSIKADGQTPSANPATGPDRWPRTTG
jgi:DNA-binding LytR/AlgR family response regulator